MSASDEDAVDLDVDRFFDLYDLCRQFGMRAPSCRPFHREWHVDFTEPMGRAHYATGPSPSAAAERLIRQWFEVPLETREEAARQLAQFTAARARGVPAS